MVGQNLRLLLELGFQQCFLSSLVYQYCGYNVSDLILQPEAHHVVIGLGKTGLSCIGFLQARGIKVSVVDSRLLPPELSACQQCFPDLPIRCGPFTAEDLADADVLVLSPGLSTADPSVLACHQKGVPIIGDIELFARVAQSPIVAITGTNGKSSVTTLLGDMAKEAGWVTRVGGNIGIPALSLIQEEEPDLYVLELSSFQLETTFSLKPKIATILNLTPDHIDRHPNFEHYCEIKQGVYKNCQMALFNRAAPLTHPNAAALAQPLLQISFGLDAPKAGEVGIKKIAGIDWFTIGNQCLLPVDALSLKGSHQVANTLAAIAMGWAIELPFDAMCRAIKKFEGLPHRCQWVGRHKGVTFINDSKSTNPGACITAVQGLVPEIPNKIVLLLGGEDKQADFYVLREIIQAHVRTVVVFGADATKIKATIQDIVDVRPANTLDDAFDIAVNMAHTGDVVLLSPACASFDQFPNYQARGKHFEDRVKAKLRIKE